MSKRYADRELTLSEAAERADVSPTWIRRLCDSGRLPSRRLGPTRWRLIPASAVDAYIQERDERRRKEAA